MKILILGASGMLGSTAFRYFSLDKKYEVYGTVRSKKYFEYFSKDLQERLLSGIDALDYESVLSAFEKVKPDIVINCIGVIKQLDNAKDPLLVLPLNSLFPHRLAKLCSLINARLIHISTDCVFTGDKGLYSESDPSDAHDLYGQSKYIGEVKEYSHAITLRTSIIGHELDSSFSLIDWFLSQKGPVKGYTNAIFSGFPTVELSKLISEYVIPSPTLSGLYHVAASPIAKFDLLDLVAKQYGHDIEIIADGQVKIDRSLDASSFNKATGYTPPSWTDLVSKMHSNREF